MGSGRLQYFTISWRLRSFCNVSTHLAYLGVILRAADRILCHGSGQEWSYGITGIL